MPLCSNNSIIRYPMPLQAKLFFRHPAIPPTTIYHIIHIVLVCACVEMFRVYTTGIIAMMIYLLAQRDAPIMKRIGKSMCVVVLWVLELAVSICGFTRYPLPATFGCFLNLGKKSGS